MAKKAKVKTPRKKRRGASKGKGSGFEREICKRLSIWWTNNPDEDDAFWRSSNSGGRATIRGRKGKRTSGHAGDITNTDKRGAKFLQLFAVEVKRGYNKAILHDLLDKSKTAKETMWESWVKQAIASRDLSNAHSFLIIAKRDQHCPLVVMEGWVANDLGLLDNFSPSALFDVAIPFKKFGIKKSVLVNYNLFAMQFDAFLEFTNRFAIKDMVRDLGVRSKITIEKR